MDTLERIISPHTPNVVRNSDIGPILSSSPAFATPAHAIRPIPIIQGLTRLADSNSQAVTAASVLPVELLPPTLRPIAFRTFTKKHNLTLTSPALKALAGFIGRHCGADWREHGLAELALEEVARAWKRLEAKVIVDCGEGLNNILRQLEECMVGGRVLLPRAHGLSRQNSDSGAKRDTSFALSSSHADNEDGDDGERDARKWLKVVSAFEQPRLLYNASKKHFERSKATPTAFPPPSHKTELFRQRYQIMHQRVLRNESFQAPSTAGCSDRQQWKITPIANLLGRSGSGHLLLGLLTVAPAGTLAISDLTGSIHLDVSQAAAIDAVETWLCPGMVVLVDGVYEEEFDPAGGSLGQTGGIGGTIGGRFIGFSIGAPRSEPRTTTLGTMGGNLNISGGFGWVDFLGLGSERAVGPRMRKIEQRLLRDEHSEKLNSNKVVVLGSCTLDNPKTLSAIRQVLVNYNSRLDEPGHGAPLAFVMHGSFVAAPAMSASAASVAGSAGSGIPDSITYKEAFDSLALLLSEFPALLRSSTWVFVPGEADPWASSFSAGAAVPIPRRPVPEVFTSRIRRAFTAANGEGKSKKAGVPGEAVWTSNPSRLSLFGPTCEMVVFRDDISGRMRRNHIPLKTNVDEQENEADGKQGSSSEEPFAAVSLSTGHPPSAIIDEDSMDVESPAPRAEAKLRSRTTAAQTLSKTLLDQSHLAPFPLSIRPQNWDFAGSSLSLYPLPTALLLCDAEMEAFALGYQGCTVVNCGSVTGLDQGPAANQGGRATWCEYDVVDRRGIVMHGM